MHCPLLIIYRPLSIVYTTKNRPACAGRFFVERNVLSSQCSKALLQTQVSRQQE